MSFAVVVVAGCSPLPQSATMRPAQRQVAKDTATALGAKVGRTRFTATGPSPTIGTPYCDAAQHCVYPGTQTLTLTGDWTGEWIQGSAAVSIIDAGKFTSAGLNLFVGKVKGCGSGTAVVRLFETGTLSPATGVGRWEIVPKFGTGGLANLRGSGTGAGGIENGVRTSKQTGRITCDHR